jgi:CheY-like chemotaxis protein
VFALRARLAVCPGPKASGGPRILLVDDNKRLLEVLHEALAGAVPGALIDVATDGYEALMQVGRFPPDLLVLDLRMPRLDGFEVCQRLKSRANTRMIRILAITAYPEGGARERILAAGADGFLEKPLDMREFRATALALLGREAVTGGLAVPTEDSA